MDSRSHVHKSSQTLPQSDEAVAVDVMHLIHNYSLTLAMQWVMGQDSGGFFGTDSCGLDLVGRQSVKSSVIRYLAEPLGFEKVHHKEATLPVEAFITGFRHEVHGMRMG